MAQHNELGQWGEAQAARFLQQGHRDIDLIALDGNVIVFVEVKTRRNNNFTEPIDAVNYHKLQNLRRAINHYIKYRHVNNAVRFDIIGIVGTPEEGAPKIEHFVDVPIL